MTDIAEFVLARAAEKEAAVNAWADTTVPWADFAVAAVDEFVHNGEPHTYLAMVDPVRVLREVAAVRAIVALHERREVTIEGEEVWPQPAAVCWYCIGPSERDCYAGGMEPIYAVMWPCTTLRSLASIFSDHPAYQEGWQG